jgi:hypothetical protein
VRQVKLLEEDEDVTPLLDSFTERVIDPWMQPCKLPALSDSDIKIFLNTSTQETETLNKDNGVLDLFQGGEDYGKITYATQMRRWKVSQCRPVRTTLAPLRDFTFLLLAQVFRRSQHHAIKSLYGLENTNRRCTDWLLTRSIQRSIMELCGLAFLLCSFQFWLWPR